MIRPEGTGLAPPSPLKLRGIASPKCVYVTERCGGDVLQCPECGYRLCNGARRGGSRAALNWWTDSKAGRLVSRPYNSQHRVMTQPPYPTGLANAAKGPISFVAERNQLV